MLEKVTMQLIVRFGNEQHTFNVDDQALVADLLVEISKNGRFSRARNIELIYDNQQLNRGQRLSEYGITNRATLDSVVQAVGGSNWVQLFDDNVQDNDLKCQMSCGHKAVKAKLEEWTQQELNMGHLNLACSEVKRDTTGRKTGVCNKPWTFQEIVRNGGFNDTKVTQFRKSLLKLVCTSKGYKECPSCTQILQKVFDKGMKQTCSMCNSGEFVFCWECLRKWNSTSANSCGNQGCELKSKFQSAILASCSLKQIRNIKDVPSIRRCPGKNCSQLIEHTNYCKHMTCPACQTQFCHICLQIADKGQWKCKGAYDMCPTGIAPRQLPHVQPN